jgi:hypothetical protein
MFYDQFMVLFQKIIKLFECGLQLESIGYDRTSLENYFLRRIQWCTPFARKTHWEEGQKLSQSFPYSHVSKF